MFLQSGAAIIPVILIFLVFHFSSFQIVWLSVHHNHFGFLVMLWIGIVFMPIWIQRSILMLIQIRILIRILPEVVHKLENHKFLLNFIYSNATFIFLISVMGVIIFSISTSILKFSGKKSCLILHFVEMETAQSDPRFELGPGCLSQSRFQCGFAYSVGHCLLI
jgi:hypothetical protein